MKFVQAILAAIGSVGVIVGLILLAARGLVHGLIAAYFDRQLEEYKNGLERSLADHTHELDLVKQKYEHEFDAYRQRLDFEYQKRLQDFGLYTTKRHEVYPTIYAGFLEAQGLMLSLYGFTQYPDFASFAFEELEAILAARRFPKRVTDEVRRRWSDPMSADLVNYLVTQWRERNKGEAQTAFEQVRRTWLLSELYVSKDVSAECDALCRVMGQYMVAVWYEQHSDYQKRTKLSDDMGSAIPRLKAAMQKELSDDAKETAGPASEAADVAAPV